MIYLIGPKNIIDYDNIQHCDVDFCLNYFKDHEEIEVDTETNSLKHIKGSIITLQIGDSSNQFVIDIRHVNIKLFKDLLETKIVLGANISFDYKFLKSYGILLNRVYDVIVTETVSFCGYNRYGYSLQDLCFRYLDIKIDKEERNSFATIGDSPLSTKQIIYAAGDVDKLALIKEKQSRRIIKYELQKTVRLENKALIPLSEIEYNGMYLNKEKWLEYEEVCIRDLKKLELELDEELLKKNNSYFCLHTYKRNNKGKTILVPYQGIDLFGYYEADRKTGINWGSHEQVKNILKKEYNFEVLDKEGKVTINSTLLGKKKNKPRLVDLLINRSEKGKEISTYGSSFIDQYIDIDGRFRTSFWQVQVTGRVSSNSPNVQNIPEKHRAFVEAPKGRKLVICDYSQQEPRITAEYCKDPKLTDFVLNGDGDSHSLVASAVFSKIEGKEVKVSKKNNPFSERFKMTYRDVGKQINLGLDYGKTAFTIKDDLGVSKEEAQEFIDAIKSAFPEKERFFDFKKKEFWKTGYILHDYITHRKTFIEDFDKYAHFNYDNATKKEISEYYKWKGSVERCCQNYPIQGTAASMTKLALIYMYEEFKSIKGNPLLINTIHDEIVAEVDEEYAGVVADVMVKCMVKAGEVFCKKIPMKVDPVISDFWVK